jgi:hypothetical protein
VRRLSLPLPDGGVVALVLVVKLLLAQESLLHNEDCLF